MTNQTNRQFLLAKRPSGEPTADTFERVAEFARWYEALPAADQGIKIFPVLFGEARSAELATLADLSGGRVFDSRKSSLPVIFKEIRGYQ